ncbi:MAG: DNA polymerase III subunit delta, partial [Candidatus Delongbacteria bacterium]|nr:DNA polymerase III subunit delta [Candidatus Delongbacteria bacterium]
MTFNQILKDIDKRIFQPVYLLWGEESYFIDAIVKKITETVLTESEKSFNQTILYGKDTNAYEINEIARRYPMMANHQLVIVKEAQELKDFKRLESYVSDPLKSTILVFAHKYKKIDKRLKIIKKIDENGLVFESKRVYENKIPAWIESYLVDKNLRIVPKATMLLSENLGSGLSKIVNELDKLIITMPEGADTITPEMVEKNIGISRDFNIFELQRALGARNKAKAYLIIDFFGKNPKNNPAVLTVMMLFAYFKRILVLKTLKDKSRNA